MNGSLVSIIRYERSIYAYAYPSLTLRYLKITKLRGKFYLIKKKVRSQIRKAKKLSHLKCA